MITKLKIVLVSIGLLGVLVGVSGTLAVIHFDDLRATFQTARWSYPELATVRVEGCTIKGLPEDVLTFALMVERGDLLTDLALNKRALYDTKGIEVTVTRRDRPVVLVLAAEKSAIWDVSIAKGVRLAAVIVFGEEAQGLVGVPRSIPHLIMSNKEEASDCPKIRLRFARTRRTEEYQLLESAIESILNRPIDFFQSAQVGIRLIAGPRRKIEPDEILHSNELESDYLVAADVMPAGRDGLDWLVQKGLIRAATNADVDAWIAGVVPSDLPQNAQLKVRHGMRPGRTFVVLGKIAIPDIPSWGRAYSFILPEGVPEPDFASETTIYRMHDFSCSPKSACRR